MKKILSACLEQTLHFQLEDEFYSYKNILDRKLVHYKIIDMAPNDDGSVIVRIKRQYNAYNCGDYLN